MRIGVPQEIKNQEYRVSMTPAGVFELTSRGHRVLVETGAGVGAGFSDDQYTVAGASIVDTADEVWEAAELVVKVKEPVGPEYGRMREGQILFTYLHLAADRPCAEALLESGTTAIAYETVEGRRGDLPLLAPMSEVAGRLAAQVGAVQLTTPVQGPGLLLGGVPGVPAARVTVIGGGVAGSQAATIAAGMGAQVTVLDVNIARLREIDVQSAGRIRTRASTAYAVTEACGEADLVIGAVLLAGAKAPTVVSNALVAQMRPASVLVDIAIDQGGCFEDSRPTTHADPTYRVHDSTFYCVANMPGAVPRTSTMALTNVTLPYVVALAEEGWRSALGRDPGFARGLNAHAGVVTNRGVAEALGSPFAEAESVIEGGRGVAVPSA